ncbi:hypothetical protein RhiirA4_481677 [Rhizophagus irregularis]|uniref:Uncharacterized protein n=1 Tax=Rhizophagus irregularis TaxID=588596 RepID=A0A2I1HJX8_9GLOM|nr:hypothetical protein RhiirA4_481677 [Rhizophagus irregularis]
MSSEYKNTEYKYRFLKDTAKSFNSGSRDIRNRQKREKYENSLSRTEQSFLKSIRKDTVHRKETIQEIVLRCSDISSKIYREEINRLAWKNSKLQEELQETSHVIDKKGKEEKHKERIILQKNEQIRKISQELEKTRSELKKVKIDNNKEIDQHKNSKKSRSTSNRRKRKAILEIPILPEISSADLNFEKTRDLFFYNLPKY